MVRLAYPVTLPALTRRVESRRGRLVGAFLVFLFSFLLRGTNLDHPPAYYFDEVYYVYTAQRIARGDPRAWEWWHENPEGFAIEWTHPPLAKLAIAQSIRWFGDRPIAWRLPGALAVAGASALFFGIGTMVFRSGAWGLVLSFLFSFDLLPFVQARIATPEAFLYLFVSLALFCLLRRWQTGARRWFLFSGLSWGLLLATKWNTAPVVLLFGLASLLSPRRAEAARRSGRWREASVLLAPALLLAAVTYLAFFLPFFAAGHTKDQFLELHRQMFWYHSRLDATHPYQSAFWQWPLILRSIWYYSASDPATGTVANIYALGNPAVWWSGAVALVWLFLRALSALRGRRRGEGPGGGEGRPDPLPALLVAAYLLLWLPYALSPRVMFLYHYLPASLVLLLGLVYALRELAREPRGGAVVTALLASVLLTFLFLHPIAAGTFISPGARDARLLLRGWR